MKRAELLKIVAERYGVQPEYLWARWPNYAALRHAGNRKWFGVLMDVPARRLGLSEAGADETVDILNVKVAPDNVIVLQDFTAGADFEMPYDVRFFTGAANGNEWRDATAQIVEKDGSNVLMMTGANSLWPTFKIDFGETLKAGTTISFDVLGVIDYEQEGMSMTFNPIDSNVVTDEYGQAVWMLCDEWTNKTITLSADCSSISFYWDAGRNGLSDGIVSYVYIDNVVVNAA